MAEVAYDEKKVTERVSIFNRERLESVVAKYRKKQEDIDMLIHSIYIQVIKKNSLMDLDVRKLHNCSPYLIKELEDNFVVTESTVMSVSVGRLS
jgi:hypothetical protein